MSLRKPPEGSSWYWQATHERDGWFSQSKTQRLIAFALSSFIIMWCVIKSNILPLLPELLGVYLGYAIIGRAASRWIATKEDKPKEE